MIVGIYKIVATTVAGFDEKVELRLEVPGQILIFYENAVIELGADTSRCPVEAAGPGFQRFERLVVALTDDDKLVMRQARRGQEAIMDDTAGIFQTLACILVFIFAARLHATVGKNDVRSIADRDKPVQEFFVTKLVERGMQFKLRLVRDVFQHCNDRFPKRSAEEISSLAVNLFADYDRLVLQFLERNAVLLHITSHELREDVAAIEMDADTVAAVGLELEFRCPIAGRSVLQLSVIPANTRNDPVSDDIAEVGRVIGPIVSLKRPELRGTEGQSFAVCVDFAIILKSDPVRQKFWFRVTASALDREAKATRNVVLMVPDEMDIVGVGKCFKDDFRHLTPPAFGL